MKENKLMKLNIGSGPNAVEGFVNLDFSPNVLLSRVPILKWALDKLGILKPEHMTVWDNSIKYKDARKLNYPRDSVEIIYSSHFLEHVYFWEAQEILISCHRFLKSDGVIRLALPDYKMMAEKFIEAHKTNELSASWDFNRSLLSYPFEKAEMFGFLLNSRFGHVHKWHPTAAIVKEMLSNAGFSNITIHSFREGPFPEIDKLEERSEGTFYIQAIKH